MEKNEIKVATSNTQQETINEAANASSYKHLKKETGMKEELPTSREEEAAQAASVNPINEVEGASECNESNFNFSLDLNGTPLKTTFNNEEAWFYTSDRIMAEETAINLSFGVDSEDYAYAWLETSKTAPFKLRLNNEILKCLYSYLTTGKTTEVKSAEPNDPDYKDKEYFKFNMAKLFIEKGHTIQWVPQFREYNNTMSGLLALRKGKITFHIKREKNLVETLRELNQAV